MRFPKPLASILVIAALSATALAVVIQGERTPENPGDFSVTSEMGEDGLVHFAVTCKVARPCWIKAYLLVRKGETRIVETHFPAVVREDSIEYSITYNFAISPEYLDDSTLELAERGIGYSVNPADERHPLPGTGGTDNVFQLKKFAPSEANADYTPNDVLDRLNASRKPGSGTNTSHPVGGELLPEDSLSADYWESLDPKSKIVFLTAYRHGEGPIENQAAKPEFYFLNTRHFATLVTKLDKFYQIPDNRRVFLSAGIRICFMEMSGRPQTEIDRALQQARKAFSQL